MVSTSLWMDNEILPAAGAFKGEARCDIVVVGSSDPLFKQALAQIAKGGGLFSSRSLFLSS